MNRNPRSFVLMYHRINDKLPAGEWVVSVARFREQMDFLKEHCKVVEIPRPDLDNRGRGWASRPKIVITFDDGYRDNYQNAFSVLKKLKLPATIFLTTGYIGISKKRPRYKNTPWRRDYLNWQEVKEMAENGITFGAHTVSHPHLAQLDYTQQKEEIEGSIAVISHRVTMSQGNKLIFSYPYGEYNSDTVKILKRLGMKLAFTVKPGAWRKGDDPLKIKRIGISGLDSLSKFKSKVSQNAPRSDLGPEQRGSTPE